MKDTPLFFHCVTVHCNIEMNVEVVGMLLQLFDQLTYLHDSFLLKMGLPLLVVENLDSLGPK